MKFIVSQLYVKKRLLLDKMIKRNVKFKWNETKFVGAIKLKLMGELTKFITFSNAIQTEIWNELRYIHCLEPNAYFKFIFKRNR